MSPKSAWKLDTVFALSVRHVQDIEKLRKIFSRFSEQVEYIIVPDFTSSIAFDTALSGAEYIFYLVSTLSFPADRSMPAVEGTLSLLKAAAKHPSIKKVVFTGSVDSFVPLQQNWEGMVIKTPLTRHCLFIILETNDISLNNTPTTLGGVAQYHASKIASFQTVVRYAECHKPKFSIVTLHPVFVFGTSLIQESAQDLSYDSRMLIKALYSETPDLRCFSGVHVIDVAEAHLRSLHCSITGLSSFLLASKARPWRHVHDFVQSAYPYAGFRLLPHQEVAWLFDTTKAVKELGIRFKEMEEQICDAIEQQLKFRGG